MEWWLIFKDWFLSLGTKYNVNPYIFGGIYLGAIPFFFFFLRMSILKIRQKKPFVVPLLLTGLSFVSAYLYFIIVGKDIPVWVYVFIGLMLAYGVYSTIGRLRKGMKES